MTSVTLSQFRNQQSNDIVAEQCGPAEITSRGVAETRRIGANLPTAMSCMN
ncbi:hypothetical protein [Kocuria sp. TGY1127_2]|uniref:hypothetical protein n=1 Tax=Kocuria sp. TGY1127_2 TaxID=2711328 RepID=UPI001FADD0AA|nr:hypothetical protein [Kocuria sp. TGY1127_2]